jgi:hypothetical protein
MQWGARLASDQGCRGFGDNCFAARFVDECDNSGPSGLDVPERA